MKNREKYHLVKRRFMPAYEIDLANYLIGSLSVVTDPDEWDKCLKLAGECLTKQINAEGERCKT